MSRSVFMIAGEASGDALGGPLMREMKSLEGDIHFTGIGGKQMEAEGLESLLPMDEICVMGLWEVVFQLPRLLRLIHGMVEEIEKRQPDILVTIDLPDFNFQVAKRLKKRGIYKGKIIHYVAPTVWAWRPGRAKKVAGFLDGLLCLFPFEPAYFQVHGLDARFVGHPLVEHDPAGFDGAGFRARHGIPEDARVLGVFFGSRRRELAVHGPVFIESARLLKEKVATLYLVVPTLPELHAEVAEYLNALDVPHVMVSGSDVKWHAMAACDMALAVSGTVGLELAYAGVPHVIGYKMHPLSWLLVRLLVKTKYAHLANILMDRAVVPEFLQKDCVPEKISKSLEGIENIKFSVDLGAKPSEEAARYLLT